MSLTFAVKNVLYSSAPAIEFAEPLPEHGAVRVGDDIALLLVTEQAFEELGRVTCRYRDGVAMDEADLTRADELIVRLAGLNSTFELHAGTEFGVFIVRSAESVDSNPGAMERMVSALQRLGMDEVTVRPPERKPTSLEPTDLEPPVVAPPPVRSGARPELARILARCAIGNFPGGRPGRIVGVLDMIGEPLAAPISQRPCAAYVVQVDEFVGLGVWHTVLHVIRSLDYLAIRDHTGSALVELDRAQVQIVADTHVRTGFMRSSNKLIARFLHSYGQTLYRLGPIRRLRVKEGVLEPGETVAAIGIGAWEASAQSALRSFRDNAQRLAFRHREDGHLLVTDEPTLTAPRIHAESIPISLVEQLSSHLAGWR